MVKDVEEDVQDGLDCKSILLIGGAVLAAFIAWNFYNTSRLHDLVQQLLNRPDPVMRSHDGEHETESNIVRTQNGRGSC